jgi:hypothetical protein
MRPILLLARLSTILLALSGCSALDSMSLSPQRDPYTLYLKPASVALVRTEMRDRYACASGVPLTCQCTSRLGGDCECRC